MSELSRLVRATQALGMWLEQSDGKGSSTILDKEKECAEVRERLNDLLNKSGKLDPITNLPRFGVQATEKIRGALSESEKLLSILIQLGSVAREEEEQRALLESQRRNAQEEGFFPAHGVDLYEAVNLPLSDTGKEEELAKIEEEKERQVALSVAAEQARMKRASDKTELREVLKTLNNSPKCATEFAQTIETLSVGARQFLGDILTRILANPNDERLRRLRLSHPKVWATFTKYAPALSSLAQLGFEAYMEPNTDDGTEMASLSLSEGDDLPRKLLQLSVSSRSNVIFAMAEPSVEEDSTSWIRWFDKLTAYRQMIT